ncbi:hypothetical protein QUF81_16415 [Peribacillus simplex]|nr:hypothetical protein [Peribacillus simplex]MDM5294739.1 hypothetical protein [Peribacillus simplex]
MKIHIPVFEDEIQFEGNKVIVEHNGKSGIETSLKSGIDLILLGYLG